MLTELIFISIFNIPVKYSIESIEATQSSRSDSKIVHALCCIGRKIVSYWPLKVPLTEASISEKERTSASIKKFFVASTENMECKRRTSVERTFFTVEWNVCLTKNWISHQTIVALLHPSRWLTLFANTQLWNAEEKSFSCSLMAFFILFLIRTFHCVLYMNMQAMANFSLTG